MADNIIVALVVAIVGSGSLAVLVGKIFGKKIEQTDQVLGKVIDKTFGLLGNHMSEVKGAIGNLTQTIAEHDKHEMEGRERWLEAENLRVELCNNTMRELLGKDK